MIPGTRLAVQIVLDGPPTPAWQARTLTRIREQSRIEVVGVRALGTAPRGRCARVCAAAERRFLRLGADALAVAAEPTEQPETPDGLAAACSAGSLSGSAGEELIVWLSDRPPPEGLGAQALRVLHEGLPTPTEEAFTRAAIDGLPYVISDVVIERGGRAMRVARTVSAVRVFSPTLSRDLALWKLADLLPRVLARPIEAEPPVPDGACDRPPPRPAALVRHVASSFARAAGTRLLYSRPWSVRVRERRPSPRAGWSAGPGLVRWRRGHLYADPFLIEREGRHHLFCEEVRAGERTGLISHTELPPRGGLASPPEPVLAQPYHLSYPFVFTHDGEALMIPETSAMKRVELYRATSFPARWELDTIVMEGVDAADATILADGGRLWMFVAIAAPHASSLDELHLFWADDPRGPWRAHPRNPVVSDVRCARPAGPVQRWHGSLVRPGQDGSRRYGGAISFRRIDVMTEHDYAEHEVARLEPGDAGAGARATHTYAADSRFEAIDVRTRELRVRRWLETLGARARVASAETSARR